MKKKIKVLIFSLLLAASVGSIFACNQYFNNCAATAAMNKYFERIDDDLFRKMIKSCRDNLC